MLSLDIYWWLLIFLDIKIHMKTHSIATEKWRKKQLSFYLQFFYFRHIFCEAKDIWMRTPYFFFFACMKVFLFRDILLYFSKWFCRNSFKEICKPHFRVIKILQDMWSKNPLIPPTTTHQKTIYIIFLKNMRKNLKQQFRNITRKGKEEFTNPLLVAKFSSSGISAEMYALRYFYNFFVCFWITLFFFYFISLENNQ